MSLQSLDIQRRSATTTPPPQQRQHQEVAKLINVSKCIGFNSWLPCSPARDAATP